MLDFQHRAPLEARDRREAKEGTRRSTIAAPVRTVLAAPSSLPTGVTMTMSLPQKYQQQILQSNQFCGNFLQSSAPERDVAGHPSDGLDPGADVTSFLQVTK